MYERLDRWWNHSDIFAVDWMNALQHISNVAHGSVFVTLNPLYEPDPTKVVGTYKYDHPVLDNKVNRSSSIVAHLFMIFIS